MAVGTWLEVVVVVAVELLVKAAEWGAQVVQASNTKAQKRSADVLEKCAVIVAGLQHMDRRFTDLFVPLVFYDPGSWPIERRRTWAEDALGFIHGDRVVDRLGQAITYLEATPVDDRQLAALVQDLCDISHVALWGSVQFDVEAPPAAGDHGEASLRGGPPPYSWTDNTLRWHERGVLGERWSGGDTPTHRTTLDPDSYAAPAVARLVALVRSESPDPEHVARAASDCLVRPPDIGDRESTPLGVAPPASESAGGDSDLIHRPDQDRLRDASEKSYRPNRLRAADLWALDYEVTDSWSMEEDAERWPKPLNTVSPLRDFADNAGRRFQQILSLVRQSFPGLPEPAWLWDGPAGT